MALRLARPGGTPSQSLPMDKAHSGCAEPTCTVVGVVILCNIECDALLNPGSLHEHAIEDNAHPPFIATGLPTDKAHPECGF